VEKSGEERGLLKEEKGREEKLGNKRVLLGEEEKVDKGKGERERKRG
jgi:hypothetical protein